MLVNDVVPNVQDGGQLPEVVIV